MRCTRTLPTNGWPISRCLISTTCGRARHTAGGGSYTSRQRVRPWRLANAGARNRREHRVGCGDPRDGKKGLYHINAVDTVTQWQVVGCVETISEQHLLPALEAMIHQFPFRIRGFHSDNGSEVINHRVAKMLEKLRISEFTKSRANRTTDNALVEGKNGTDEPYLNFHRPSGFAEVTVNELGKRRRRYRTRSCRPSRRGRSV